MKINEIITEAVRQRLDPKCWKGKHKEGTKIKGGVRVNNCVPNEGVAEGSLTTKNVAPVKARPLSMERPKGEWDPIHGKAPKKGTLKYDMWKQRVAQDKKGVAENAEKLHIGDPIIITGKGIEFEGTTGEIVSFGQQNRFVVVNLYNHGKHSFHSSDVSYNEYAGSDEEEARAYDSDPDARNWNMDEQGMAEASNTMQRYGQLILKRAKAKREAEAAEKAKQDAEQEKNKSVDKGLAADKQFDIIESMVESLANAHGVDPEVIWEDFESVNDRELYETAAWHRKAGKNKNGGLNAKGVASYRREHPGSKLQTAVTTKPSKLKPGSKAAKRRKSFCARMSGNKGPMKKPNGDPTRKALALRKWNC